MEAACRTRIAQRFSKSVAKYRTCRGGSSCGDAYKGAGHCGYGCGFVFFGWEGKNSPPEVPPFPRHAGAEFGGVLYPLLVQILTTLPSTTQFVTRTATTRQAGL